MRKLLLSFLSFMTISSYADKDVKDVNVTFTLTGDGVKDETVYPCLLYGCDGSPFTLKVKGFTVIQFGVGQSSDILGDPTYPGGIVWDSSCTKTFPFYRKGTDYGDSSLLRYPSLLSGGSLHITATSTIKNKTVYISNCHAVR